MAFDTYAGLRTSVAAWLDRSDMDAVIPDLITLAEARLNDKLRVAAMESRAFLALSDAGEANLPDDFLEARMALLFPGGLNIITDEETGIPIGEQTGAIWTDGNTAGAPRNVLRRVEPEWAIETFPASGGGCQTKYTILENTFTVFASQASSAVLYYYAKIPALSDDAPTNWLLTKKPNIYLYATLLESAPFMQDDSRIVTWERLLDTAITDFTLADQMARWSNGLFKLSGPTP